MMPAIAPNPNTTPKLEWLTCAESPAYFIHHFVQIYDATARMWVPFILWPAQLPVLRDLQTHQLIIILKARQLGLTWLVLAYMLWEMLFQPIATALAFSKRDDEAIYLLSDERLRGMYQRLPDWLKARATAGDNAHEFGLSNGSIARGFPTTAGDSYTATLAMVDEADLVLNLGKLMGAVKPTIDNGGKMILLSRADKSRPSSEFKQIYRAAREGRNAWHAIFLPWHAHPKRTAEWYERMMADSFSRTGSLDDLHEQYPATEAEALSPRTLDKRIPTPWLEKCYAPCTPLESNTAPALPNLAIYVEPVPGKTYCIGADPAEGNPNSDESAACVLEAESGEQVAELAGRFEPAVFGDYISQIGIYYNHADVLTERNNHGHAVILYLSEHSPLQLLTGMDNDIGWQTNIVSKSTLYTVAAEAFRDAETRIHSLTAFTQLASIEAGVHGVKISAPQGEHDDRATAYVLALQARVGMALTGQLGF